MFFGWRSLDRFNRSDPISTWRLLILLLAPYKTIVTHGFILDAKGKKMSKSEGNIIPPQEITHGGKTPKDPPYGVDVLRWFMASSDYTKDVTLGPMVIRMYSTVAPVQHNRTQPHAITQPANCHPCRENFRVAEKVAQHVTFCTGKYFRLQA